MTAIRIDLHNYVETLRNTIPDIHPAGRATINIWLGQMTDAANQANTTTFANLAQMITNKVDLELRWQHPPDTDLGRGTSISIAEKSSAKWPTAPK